MHIPNTEVEAQIEQTITMSYFYDYKFKGNMYFPELSKHFEVLNECKRTYIRVYRKRMQRQKLTNAHYRVILFIHVLRHDDLRTLKEKGQ